LTAEYVLRESMRSSNGSRNANNESDLEHKRRSTLEILRQRKIFTDSEIGKILGDDTNIQTLLNIIQKEKEKNWMQNQPSSTIMKTPKSRPSIYDPWHHGYRSLSELIYELNMAWLIFLTMNPITGWFFHPFVFGWTQ
jgi:hypothetical protein